MRNSSFDFGLSGGWIYVGDFSMDAGYGHNSKWNMFSTEHLYAIALRRLNNKFWSIVTNAEFKVNFNFWLIFSAFHNNLRGKCPTICLFIFLKAFLPTFKALSALTALLDITLITIFLSFVLPKNRFFFKKLE